MRHSVEQVNRPGRTRSRADNRTAARCRFDKVWLTVLLAACCMTVGGVGKRVRAQSVAGICTLVARADASENQIVQYWRDASPHSELRMREEDDVDVDVLNWGGRTGGLPVVWIPGANSSAHVFDDIAPMFRTSGIQLGLTPRGQRPSSVPDSGYGLEARARDVLVLMDSLHVKKAVLIGHSLAGDVLTYMVQRYPARVAALVFLDAAYNRGEPLALVPHELIQPPTSVHRGTLVGTLDDRCAGRNAPGSAEVTELILQWTARQPQSRVGAVKQPNRSTSPTQTMRRLAAGMWPGNPRVPPPKIPVLILYAQHSDRDELRDALGFQDDPRRLRQYQAWWDASRQPMIDLQRRQVARNWPDATVVTISDASHFIMWSNPSQVQQAIQALIDSAQARLAIPGAPDRND